VALILAVSSISILLLYSNFRETEFYSRVKSEGNIFHDLVSEIKDSKKAVMAKMVSGVYTNTVFDEKLMVLDSTGKVLSKLPETFNLQFDQTELKKSKRIERFIIKK